MNPIITEEQRTNFFRNGFVTLQGVVPQQFLDRAVRAINMHFTRGISEDDAEKFINGQLFPDLQGKPAIGDLFNKTAAKPLAESMIGEIGPTYGGQIALRFPGSMCIESDELGATPSPNMWWEDGWHIDGFGKERRPGEINNFSMLFGVFLKDCPLPFHGNLMVFPGTHWILQNYFRENCLEKTANSLEGDDIMPKGLPFPTPIQVTGKAGDVVMAHYQLAHSIAPNLSPDIRYVVYFRLYSKLHQPQHKYRPSSILDIWQDWPAMQPLIQSGQVVWGGPPVADQEVADLKKIAETFFEKKEWKDARAVYYRLVQLRPLSAPLHYKAAGATAWSSDNDPEALRLGERSARTCIQLCPLSLEPYGTLARILLKQKRYQEVAGVVDTLLSCPHPNPPSRRPKKNANKHYHHLVIDGLRCVSDAAAQLRTPALSAEFIGRALGKYPELSEEISKLRTQRDAVDLWAQGKRIMDMPHHQKDWAAGQQVFTRLAQLHPDNYWAHLQAGACFTYGHRSSVTSGEGYVRRALEIDPLCAAGYGVLARNLQLQNRPLDVIPIFDACINCVSAEKQEHGWALTECACATRDALVSVHRFNEWPQRAQRFREAFPFVAQSVPTEAGGQCNLM